MEHDHNYCAKIPDEENNEVPGEEEGMTGESQDGQVPDLGGLTSHSDLTPDQIAFVVTKSLKYKDLKRQWTKVFKRAPPSRCTVDRHRRRFRETNSIKNCRTGRKPSVRTPEMIAEVKRVLEEESDASPNQFVNRARNNQWGVGDQQGDFPEHHERHQVSSICSASSSDIEHRQHSQETGVRSENESEAS